MRIFLIFINVNILVNFSFGQIPGRYTTSVFQNTVETKNVKFSDQVPVPVHQTTFIDLFGSGEKYRVDESELVSQDLFMDIFEPQGDTISKRPVIILCFGGGFVRGSRNDAGIRLLAETLARYGYVTASMDYRIGMYILDAGMSSRAVYRGVQDTRSAVRYFKANAETYRIDTNFIFLGGHSSGAFSALHNIYLDKEEYERPCTTYDTTQVVVAGSTYTVNIPDQGCLDCVGNNQQFNGKAKAAINLAGALGFLDLIEDNSDEGPISFHSTDDGTVPYDTGMPFEDNFGAQIVGADLPVVFGSSLIAQRCNSLGITNEYYEYTNRGHAVHENGTALYPDIVPNICNWLYNSFLKPELGQFAGVDLVCANDNPQIYEFNQPNISYYDWQVTGGNITSSNPTSNQITVVWDPQTDIHSIGLLPFANNGTPGSFQEIMVEIVDSGNNQWLGDPASEWNDISNWSRGHLPLPCETLYFPGQASETVISVPENLNIQCQGIYLGQNIRLEIPVSSTVIGQN